MNRESSIQLVYQLSMLIHNLLNYPIIELVYQDLSAGVPTAQWCSTIILQCISAFLSAYSTLSLPIQTAEMQSLKERGFYRSFRINFCMLSKRIFQLIWHLCITYVTIYLVMVSDRFEYFRNFVVGKIGEANSDSYAFVIYGSIIFLVFPLLVIFENFLALSIIVAGESREKLRKILSKYGQTLRNRV